MNIELPMIPAGVLVLLGFFAPYAIALVNQPSWTPTSKKLISIAVSIALALVSLVFYYFITGDELVWENWPMLVILFILVSQASYTLVTKRSATVVEIASSSNSVKG